MSRINLSDLIRRRKGVKNETSVAFCYIADNDFNTVVEVLENSQDDVLHAYVKDGSSEVDLDIYPEANIAVLKTTNQKVLKKVWNINYDLLIYLDDLSQLNDCLIDNNILATKRQIRVSYATPKDVTKKYGSAIEFIEDNNVIGNKAARKPTHTEEVVLPYVEKKSSLKGYEWYEHYKEPDASVLINQKHLDLYWYFIYERLKIYHNRVVLGKPFPWTDDTILQEYRFTNICRDMDKMSIWEIQNILSKLDEPIDDIELRKKSVMANIMLYRTFVKIDTYKAFGFIDLADKNWKKQWDKGADIILKRREAGEANFTGSFMTNNLHGANSDTKTNWNKTYNGICMARYFFDHIDEIYDACVTNCSGMKEQLEYLQFLPGTGLFTSYEFACSFAMSSRYCENPLVPWTQDNYTSAGPGSKRGTDAIFLDRGNLSYVDAIIYLRSIWKHEMKRLGYYDEFVKMLPEKLNDDIDLRVIEHCLCEFSKYIRCYYKSGFVKRRFSLETTNLEELTL